MYLSQRLIFLIFVCVVITACDLSVDVQGVGKITTADGRIDCGHYGYNCIFNYDPSSEVTLSATPAPNYRFVRWQGTDCDSTPVCTIHASTPRHVSAQFEIIQQSNQPINDIAFNSKDLRDCVISQSQEQNWVNSFDVISLHCEGLDYDLSGIEQLPQLNTMEVASSFDSYIGGINQFIHPLVRNTHFLADTAIQSLQVEHSYAAPATSSPGITMEPIAGLTELSLIGPLDPHLPSLTGFDSLQSFHYERGNCTEFNYLVKGNRCAYIDNPVDLTPFLNSEYAPALGEMTIYAQKIPCTDVSQLFLQRPELMFNGMNSIEDFETSYSCINGFYDTRNIMVN